MLSHCLYLFTLLIVLYYKNIAEIMRVYYCIGLRILLALHQDLRCTKEEHEAFWEAHNIPSAASLMSLLQRIKVLYNCRCSYVCDGLKHDIVSANVSPFLSKSADAAHSSSIVSERRFADEPIRLFACAILPYAASKVRLYLELHIEHSFEPLFRVVPRANLQTNTLFRQRYC